MKRCEILFVALLTLSAQPALAAAEATVESSADDESEFEAKKLLAKGVAELDDGKHQRASQTFQKILEAHPNSSSVQPARFNLGLALFRQDKGEPALNAFDAYLQGLSPHDLQGKLNAQLKRGAALSLLGRHQEVAVLYDALLKQKLTPIQKIEVLTDSGIGHFMLKDYDTAEFRFLKARKVFREGSRTLKSQARYHIGQADFHLAEIKRIAFSKLTLTLSEAEKKSGKDALDMHADKLELKALALLDAQDAYIAVIRRGHRGWASAAGYKVGTMYEDVYRELKALPVPDDLSPKAQKLYRNQLAERIAILLRKAIRIWEQTLSMATRTRTKNMWVKKSRASLERVRSYLLTLAPEDVEPAPEKP